MRRRIDRGRRRLHRHSRTAVFAAAVFTVITFAAGAWGSASLGAWLRDPLFADKLDRMRERLTARSADGRAPVSIVMIGSSRTSNALRGTDLECHLGEFLGRPIVAFNFGIPSSGPVTQLLYLRRLLAAGVHPELVLFEIMPPLLAGQVPEPIEHHFFAPERLLPGEAEFVAAHSYPADKFAAGERIATWLPGYGLRMPIRGRYLPAWSPWNLRFDSSRNSDKTGWMRPVFDPVTPEQYERGVDWAHKEYADLLRTLRMTGPATDAVRESIEFCRSAGVPIALVLMPEGSAFRSMYPPHALVEIDAFVRHAGCPIIDARHWLEDDAFSDSHHMISHGARAFTERLGRTLLESELLR
jgi:hypothetical protein